jgi:thiamine biosynthesis lipoprotein
MSYAYNHRIVLRIAFKLGLLLIFISLTLVQLIAQDYQQQKSVFEKAKSENKPVFLIFSGSDWCMPCIKFEKEVLSDPEFIAFAEANLVMLTADFPQRKKQDKDLVKQNETLAEIYNPQGYFPHLLLINANGDVLNTFDYHNQSTMDFINEFEPYYVKSDLKTITKQVFLMGSAFELTIVDSSVEHGWEMMRKAISEIERVETSISSWKDHSQTSTVNAMAGTTPLIVDSALYGLIERSLAISKLTQGAFDITFGGLEELYIFDKLERNLPDKNQISKALQHVGYQHVELLSENGVFINSKEVKIGFGAIGKGYAADKTKQLMINHGVKGGVINASGDLTVWGKQADGKPWKVGISNPLNKKEILFWLPVENKSVATSGNYEKYFTNNGVRFGHIINPVSGYPTTGIMSVTIISQSAELSDALATSVFVMGVEAGMEMIDRMDGVSCIIIVDLENIYFSEDIKSNFFELKVHAE